MTRDVFLVANNVEELGGVQRVTHNLAMMLHERGHRVTVVGIQHATQPHDYGDRPYRWLVLNEEPEPPMPKEAGLRGRLDPRVRAARDAHRAARKAAVGAAVGAVRRGRRRGRRVHAGLGDELGGRGQRPATCT